MRIDNNGNVGVNTNAPSANLSVNGTANKTGGGSWTVFSDSRLKKEISEYKDGLNIILKINPIWFSYNNKAGIKSTNRYIGILAQDIQKIAPYTISKVKVKLDERDKEETEVLCFDPSSLDFMLINAIKEQQEQIEEQRAEIDALKAKSENLNFNLDGAKIEQNNPNPFTQKTEIKYFIPENSGTVSLNIYNLSGMQIKSVSINQKGKGSITINGSELVAGIYIYNLIIDGKEIDYKRMVLTN